MSAPEGQKIEMAEVLVILGQCALLGADRDSVARALDDEVHAFKSDEATTINNAGPHEQIHYLLNNGMEFSHLVNFIPELQVVLDSSDSGG